MFLCMSTDWSELALCLQPQEGHEIDWTKSLEAGAKEQTVAKGAKCSQSCLAFSQLFKSKGTHLRPYTQPQDINLLILGSRALTEMNHLALLPPSRPTSQPFRPQQSRSPQVHILSVRNSTCALPLETKNQPKEVRRLRNWVKEALWIRKWLHDTNPLGESRQARGTFSTRPRTKWNQVGASQTLQEEWIPGWFYRWGTTT